LFLAISRSRAAEQKAEKRLGGAPATFRGVSFMRAAQGSRWPSERLHFLRRFTAGSFLYASKEMNIK